MILVLAGTLVSGCAGAASNGAAATTTTITTNVVACSAIDNQVLGRYRSLSVRKQNIAGQQMLNAAKHAADPVLVDIARQLQKAADSRDLAAMDAELTKLAQRCNRLGIGPRQVGPLVGQG